METYLIYIAKAAIAAGAFYIAFLLLFQNQKHFTFNRIYLPVSLALSFVIPLITFTTIKYIEPVTIPDSGSFAYLPAPTEVPQQPAFVFEWYHYLFGLYLLGTAGFLFHLLLGHLKAINIIQKSRVQKIFDNLVNITLKDVHPFSFFSKIVVSEKTLSHPDLEMIVSHENIHVREKHTLDILFTEVLFLLQWFNPFAWLLKDAVKNNLEYLTDHEIAKLYNPKTYQLAMVTLADKQGIAPFLTALNGSQLKNRIVMMKKKTENKYAIVKQLVVLPLLAVLVMGLANREVKTEVVQNSNQNEISSFEKIIKGNVTDQKGDPISGASVIVKGATTGTITDPYGNYELQINNENETLSFLVPDFETVNIDINGQNIIDVQLKSDNSGNNSVVKATTSGTHNFTLEKEDKYIVSGKVTNEKDEPLSGVSVVDKSKLTGTITDTKGNYEIRSEGEIETLLFGKDGYEMMEVKTNGRKNIDVKLEVDNKLYIVDGKEFEAKTGKIDTDNIERIDVLKGESGSKLYGDKGKNGVVLIMTKNSEKIEPAKVLGNKQVIGNINWINNEEYSSNELSNILGIKKGDEYSKEIIEERMYGKVSDLYMDNGYLFFNIAVTERLKNDNTLDLEFTIFEGTQWKIGKIEFIGNKTVSTKDYLKKIEIKSGDLFSRSKLNQSVKTLNELIKQNAEEDDVVVMPLTENLNNEFNTVNLVFKIREKNGVIENTLKNGNENAKITSQLEFRRFIAEKIKYPAEAVETNTHGNISFFFRVDDNGKIFDIKKPNKGDINLEEIVVVSYKTKTPGRYIKNADNKILTNEMERVLESVPLIEIPEYKGKTIKINVKFELLENTDKQTILELRSAIAQTIKYPVVAQENNQQGVVEIWAYIQKDGTISRITDKKPDGKFINIDEVVVTALKSEKAVTSEKSNDLALLVKESKRVIEKLSPLNISELQGEMVCFRIRFVLE